MAQDIAQGNGAALIAAPESGSDLFIPLHRKIYTQLRATIMKGDLKPGDRLPSENELAASYETSLAPVRKALSALVSEGLAVRRRGLGSFVSTLKEIEPLLVLTSFTEAHRSDAHSTWLIELLQPSPAAPEAASAVLQVPTSEMITLTRCAAKNGEALTVFQSAVRRADFPGLDPAALVNGSLYETLETQFRTTLWRAESAIELAPAPDYVAARFGSTAAVLQIDSATYDADDRPVEFSRVYYRADRVRLTFDSHRVKY